MLFRNMECFKYVKTKVVHNKEKLLENSFDNILWLVNIIPSIVGFNISREKISIPFWIVHIFLLSYVYFAGCVVYQAHHADVASDFIKSYVNVSILILTANNSYWWLANRQMLKEVIKKVKDSDIRTIQSGLFVEKYKRLLSTIKRIILTFYGFNLGNEFTSYLWQRIDVDNNIFSMTPCVGIQSLTVSPNREICKVILGMQELTIVCVVLNFQTMMLLLISHSAVMYQILSEEIMTLDTLLNDPNHYELVKDRLLGIIHRHTQTLQVTDHLKDLYSMPMGVNFGSNTVSMCLFFFLTWEESISFMPVMVYCMLVFFLYCFLCQRLTNAAENFARAVYSCGWEKMRHKEQKVIYIMLLEAQKPVVLLAADLIPVNMYTFASTCQAIYKFTTVVKL